MTELNIPPFKIKITCPPEPPKNKTLMGFMRSWMRLLKSSSYDRHYPLRPSLAYLEALGFKDIEEDSNGDINATLAEYRFMNIRISDNYVIPSDISEFLFSYGITYENILYDKFSLTNKTK